MLLRLVSYNVREFRDDREELRALLTDIGADIVLLQESGSRFRIRRFAGDMEMELVSSNRLFRSVHNAVLFRPPWRLYAFDVEDFTREGRSRRRGFAAAHLRREGLRLTAVSAHLGLKQRERRQHARELTDFLAGVEGHVVLGVDLNEGPESDAARWIAERLYDAFVLAGDGDGETFPTHSPTARIDYLFVRDGITVHRAWVPRGVEVERASDHRPVVAEVEVPDV